MAAQLALGKEPFRSVVAKASRNLTFDRSVNNSWNLLNIIALGTALEPMGFVELCITAGFIDHSQVTCKKCKGVGTFALKRGGVCRETGAIFLIPVPNRTRATLMALITKWILAGTTIHSDCWAAYNTIM